MKTVTDDGEVIDTVTHEPIAMAPPFWKTPWNHDTDHEARATGLVCKDESKAQQHLAAEADINNILRKFMDTGQLPTTGEARYINLEEPFDLQSNMVTSHQVEQAWNALPVAVRNMLRDPRTFTDYVDHCLATGDLSPLEQMGLAVKHEPLTPPTAADQAPKGGTPPGATPDAPTPPAGPPTAPKT